MSSQTLPYHCSTNSPEGFLFFLPADLGTEEGVDFWMLNSSAVAIVKSFDGIRNLQEISSELAKTYAIQPELLLSDIIKLSSELFQKGFLIVKKTSYEDSRGK